MALHVVLMLSTGVPVPGSFHPSLSFLWKLALDAIESIGKLSRELLTCNQGPEMSTRYDPMKIQQWVKRLMEFTQHD